MDFQLLNDDGVSLIFIVSTAPIFSLQSAITLLPTAKEHIVQSNVVPANSSKIIKLIYKEFYLSAAYYSPVAKKYKFLRVDRITKEPYWRAGPGFCRRNVQAESYTFPCIIMNQSKTVPFLAILSHAPCFTLLDKQVNIQSNNFIFEFIEIPADCNCLVNISGGLEFYLAIARKTSRGTLCFNRINRKTSIEEKWTACEGFMLNTGNWLGESPFYTRESILKRNRTFKVKNEADQDIFVALHQEPIFQVADGLVSFEKQDGFDYCSEIKPKVDVDYNVNTEFYLSLATRTNRNTFAFSILNEKYNAIAETISVTSHFLIEIPIGEAITFPNITSERSVPREEVTEFEIENNTTRTECFIAISFERAFQTNPQTNAISISSPGSFVYVKRLKIGQKCRIQIKKFEFYLTIARKTSRNTYSFAFTDKLCSISDKKFDISRDELFFNSPGESIAFPQETYTILNHEKIFTLWCLLTLKPIFSTNPSTGAKVIEETASNSILSHANVPPLASHSFILPQLTGDQEKNGLFLTIARKTSRNSFAYIFMDWKINPLQNNSHEVPEGHCLKFPLCELKSFPTETTNVIPLPTHHLAANYEANQIIGQLERLSLPSRGRSKVKWNDPNFPAENSSIGPKFANLVASWCRPDEMNDQSPSHTLFLDGFNCDDILQGVLGDCWFLSTLTSLTNRTDLLLLNFYAAYPEYGFYQFRFYKYGDWQIVSVDDRIPCNCHRKPIFAHCRDPRELWVPLIEKAYAKLHGSYEKLHFGHAAYAFQDLTAGLPDFKMISPDNFPTKESKDSFWKFLNEILLENKSILTCSKKDSKRIGAEQDSGLGIRVSHIYSVLDFKTIPSGTKLCKLRNPWGNTEWQGAFADNRDSDWHPELLKFLNHDRNANDGTFWMPYDDFIQQFTQLEFCYLPPPAFQRFVIHSEWAGKTAGGGSSFPSFSKNPQYLIAPSQSSLLFLSLTQRDIRSEGTGENLSISLRVIEHSHSAPFRIKKLKYPTIAQARANTRTISIRTRIDKNKFYTVIPYTNAPKEESTFTLEIFSEHPCKVSSIGFRKTSHEVQPGKKIPIPKMNPDIMALFYNKITK